MRNAPGGFEPIQFRKADVKDDQVRLQLLRALNSCEPVDCLSDHLKVTIAREYRVNRLSELSVVLDYEYTSLHRTAPRREIHVYGRRVNEHDIAQEFRPSAKNKR